MGINMVRKKSGVRTHSIGIWIFIGTSVLLLLTIYSFVSATKAYDELVEVTNQYIITEREIHHMEEASEYLTEQARQYVVTMDVKYVDAYFMEVNVLKRRETALQKIQNNVPEEEGELYRLIQEIYDESVKLTDVEIHSMKLISVLKSYERASLPVEIQNYQLTDEELAYTNKQLQDNAYYLVFDSNYAKVREDIDNKIDNAMTELSEIMKQQQEAGDSKLQTALIQQRIYLSLLLILMILTFALIARFILIPLKDHVKSIEEGTYLKEQGVFEVRYMAHVYNTILEIRNAKNELLQHKAEHDSLTGLWNRDIFEQFKERLKDSLQPIALILIDVDCFKEVNDTYGHEVGDRALIWVADLLRQHFSENEYPMRIGGDEFAIISMKEEHMDEEIICKLIEEINVLLQSQKDGMPKLSLSVGVAFSEFGYREELYQKADKALYLTKEKGRCGCTVVYNGNAE